MGLRTTDNVFVTEERKQKVSSRSRRPPSPFSPFRGPWTSNSPSQVHSLPQTRTDERIRGGEKTEVLAERRRFGVEEDDGLVGEGGEFGVDSSDDV